MGVVYLAHHSATGRLLAVKQIKGLRDEIARKRFERESRIAQSLCTRTSSDVCIQVRMWMGLSLLPSMYPVAIWRILCGRLAGNSPGIGRSASSSSFLMQPISFISSRPSIGISNRPMCSSGIQSS